MTILGDASTAAATAIDEQQQKRAGAEDDAAADLPAPAVEETKIRKSVTIKEDLPEDGNKQGAPALERKKSLFKRRQASTSGGAGEEPGGRTAPRRSGLLAPSNINEQSSTFIEERRKSFGRGGGQVSEPALADRPASICSVK
jgi:hypothetical protein